MVQVESWLGFPWFIEVDLSTQLKLIDWNNETKNSEIDMIVRRNNAAIPELKVPFVCPINFSCVPTHEVVWIDIYAKKSGNTSNWDDDSNLKNSDVQLY